LLRPCPTPTPTIGAVEDGEPPSHRSRSALPTSHPQQEPWKHAVHDAGGANVQQAWSEVPEVPPSGILRFEYVRQERQVRSTVHYSLELCDPVEREVAVQLWQRAIVEQGDNWQNQTLDGEPMDLGEEAAAAWAVPEGGRLELDYVTFDRLFEAHYRLDLKEPDERAIACKLQERNQADEAGESFVNPRIDGVRLDAAAMKVRRMNLRRASSRVTSCALSLSTYARATTGWTSRSLPSGTLSNGSGNGESATPPCVSARASTVSRPNPSSR